MLWEAFHTKPQFNIIHSMTPETSVLDIFYTILYLAIVIFLGYISSKRVTSEGFLIADRKLGALSNASTIIASKTGAAVLITFVALVYLYGISAMWMFIGASFGYLLFIFFAVRLRMLSSNHSFYTLSDYFFHRHGSTVGYLSGVIILVVTLLLFLMQMIGGAKILVNLTGLSYAVSLSIVALTILIYTILGGFKAVVITDMIQLLGIITFTGIIGFILIEGADVPFIRCFSTTNTTLPLKKTVSFFIIGIIVPFCSAELWQRIYAAENIDTARRSLIIAAAVYPLIGGGMLIIGLMISRKLPGIDPDTVLVEGFIHLLPAGFVGLGLVVLLAAIMSSADSYLFVNISIILQDFYVRFKPIEKKQLVLLFRYALVGLVLIIFLLSVLLRSMVALTFITLAFGSVIALTTIASWRIRKIKNGTLITGMVTGFLSTLFLISIGPVTELLVLKSVTSTIAGFLAGSLISFFVRKQLIQN